MMEIAEHEEPTSAMQRRSAKLPQNPNFTMPRSKKLRVQPAPPSERKNRATISTERRILEQQSELRHREQIEGEEGEGSDGSEVETKIAALQRIVPGGDDVGVDKLFEHTAEYILVLQCQVKAMRALTGSLEGLERNKRKLGG